MWKHRYLVALLFSISIPPGLQAAQDFDVVVYGGTSAGVAAAVAAAREKVSVAIIEPGNHLGGMSSGGLGMTDTGDHKTIGGLSREFYQRVGRYYGEDIAWRFEPHVAEAVFRKMAEEAGVKVFYRHRLREKGGVRKRGARITEIITENGDSFRAKVFVDCTYEGDLMAFAGVSFTGAGRSPAL